MCQSARFKFHVEKVKRTSSIFTLNQSKGFQPVLGSNPIVNDLEMFLKNESAMKYANFTGSEVHNYEQEIIDNDRYFDMDLPVQVRFSSCPNSDKNSPVAYDKQD